MLEKQRQQLILEILEESTFASVPELCSQLGASEATIRRDLKKLSAQKKIKKIRGGAQVIDSGSTSNFYLSGNAFLIDKEKNADIKRAIAKTACELCNDGESIIINGGSSTFMMAEFLRDKRLNVLTNSFVLAQDLVENSQNQVTLPGGEVYRKQSIILSSFENDTTQNYRGTMMFMGTPGISKYGVMESDPLLILAEKKLRKQADKLVVLADSSKIGLQSNLVFCDLDAVDIVITDNRADKAQLDEIKSYGIEVIVVDVETLAAA
ncbi:DeoR family transcriptional regulator [Alteromonas sp. KUL42]|jgi:DeoR family ulaG and ulaABCDEF operon transcriptional repressor|uniref:DeoR/GlpR family DNA-binding transcription regulator n=1 Tax=Alteromonas TaxID=226 RepID=UPI000C8F8B4C|nr:MULTISPECIES: DeoR/GlpR family DNA-binding transcription regulator [Alteromonas]MAE91002.1 DeoR family transcriptional regulator [Pelagibaca sp.]MCH2056096.1 DeoR/GlpR family DNA-binding transcription regulator [Thalassotalea sp.]GFD73775.1 DeoR family transcriptional regulator [Tenacibaculum sp. KUL113]MAE91847.1 DeoR family transcriptional regulator [Pelagibaca sp.]MCZ8531205.1 DeoR/GlpR transcriptional regulator [Alteromonas sp. PRIM-21]|tara:strand:- start:1795 stop:2592 length:798 start_codon:yes stop_codon:yes gene_type:complete